MNDQALTLFKQRDKYLGFLIDHISDIKFGPDFFS